jgi:protein TonB
VVGDSEPLGEQPLGDPNGSDTGTRDGTLDGSPDGVPGVEGGDGPPVFTGGMTRPVLLSGPAIAYPREAVEARVEGTMIAKCVITTDGAVRDCRIVKGLAYMDQRLLEALEPSMTL